MSSLRASRRPSVSARKASLNSFLEKMFCETKTRAAQKAQSMPKKLVENPDEQASITPAVSGTRDRYVARAYLILKTQR